MLNEVNFAVRERGIFGACRTLAEAKAMLDELLAGVEEQLVAQAVGLAALLNVDATDAVDVAREEIAGARERLTVVLEECGRWPAESVH